MIGNPLFTLPLKSTSVNPSSLCHFATSSLLDRPDRKPARLPFVGFLVTRTAIRPGCVTPEIEHHALARIEPEFLQGDDRLAPVAKLVPGHLIVRKPVPGDAVRKLLPVLNDLHVVERAVGGQEKLAH